MTDRDKLTVSGSCARKGHATVGYANMQVRRVAEGIAFDPHVTGSCVITLPHAELTRLVAQLTKWL